MRSVVRGAGLAVAVLAVGGCYTLHPTYGVMPAVGQRVAFDVNDAGRVALGGSIGPEIAQIEGQLLSQNGQELQLAVSAVRLLRGGEQIWRGEQVTLRHEHLGTGYVKRMSPGRSIALGVLAIGGFTAFLVSTDFLAFGLDEPAPIDSGVDVRLGRP